MLRLAICVAAGALARKESRGAHHRTDFPLRDDAHWLNRTLVRWHPDHDEPRLSYEPVGLIDLPPGDRGYGMATRTEMVTNTRDYNEKVLAAQIREGRLDTLQPLGSRIRWGEYAAEIKAEGEG
jgi:fumarate reductase flavoprotein subunit